MRIGGSDCRTEGPLLARSDAGAVCSVSWNSVYVTAIRWMTSKPNYLLDLAIKTYVAVAAMYSLYVWIVGPFSGPRSWRIAGAAIAFGLCVWLRERFTDNPFAVPLLKVFGVF